RQRLHLHSFPTRRSSDLASNFRYDFGVLWSRWTMKNAARFVILSMLVLGMAAAQNDPPSRVGRLNYISGAVSFQPGGVDDWVDRSEEHTSELQSRVDLVC